MQNKRNGACACGAEAKQAKNRTKMSAHDAKELRKCYMICSKSAMQPMLHLACILRSPWVQSCLWQYCDHMCDAEAMTMCDAKRSAGRVVVTFKQGKADHRWSNTTKCETKAKWNCDRTRVTMVCDVTWCGAKKNGVWQYTGDAEWWRKRTVAFSNTRLSHRRSETMRRE